MDAHNTDAAITLLQKVIELLDANISADLAGATQMRGRKAYIHKQKGLWTRELSHHHANIIE
ncbi:hypothetical protein HMPREF3192_00800 [Atopobium deltae]|uniref:Uncharacterized protein n=1 Tax=Atopobium deltae TaxID=1393034 RepID=A0A133XUT5_9ACTN|nr:hypothetical protein HMPREF3192_00800 [Atopobium deltae]